MCFDEIVIQIRSCVPLGEPAKKAALFARVSCIGMWNLFSATYPPMYYITLPSTEVRMWKQKATKNEIIQSRHDGYKNNFNQLFCENVPQTFQPYSLKSLGSNGCPSPDCQQNNINSIAHPMPFQLHTYIFKLSAHEISGFLQRILLAIAKLSVLPSLIESLIIKILANLIGARQMLIARFNYRETIESLNPLKSKWCSYK
uniref:Uncharacterized protein n=1 Tax=Glossina austeni TaxID=7395 RepID=A0A1A9V5D4_GLOAU